MTDLDAIRARHATDAAHPADGAWATAHADRGALLADRDAILAASDRMERSLDDVEEEVARLRHAYGHLQAALDRVAGVTVAELADVIHRHSRDASHLYFPARDAADAVLALLRARLEGR